MMMNHHQTPNTEDLQENLLRNDHHDVDEAEDFALPHENNSNDTRLVTVHTMTDRYSYEDNDKPSFRNRGAAFLFLAHLILIGFLAVKQGWPNLAFERPLLRLFVGTSIAAVLLSTAVLYTMKQQVHQLLVWTLGAAILGNAGAAVLLLWTHATWWTCGLTLILGYLSIRYLRSLWHRTQWAVVQLQVAFAALEPYALSLCVTAYMSLLVWVLWTLLWCVAWLGFYNLSKTDDDDYDDDPFNNPGEYADDDCWGVDDDNCAPGGSQISLRGHGWVVLGFFTSFYWTTAVVKNVVRVTVAGVVGSFVKGTPSNQTHAVLASLQNATTVSFGAICFGSLLTAIVQALYQLCHGLQQLLGGRNSQNGTTTSLSCLDCLLGFGERLVVYFHKWSYVYMGLHHHERTVDYLTAGYGVVQLFRDKGWWDTILITDQFILHRTLQLCSAMVALCTGALAIVWTHFAAPTTATLFSTAVTFGIPSLMGGAIAYTVFSSVLGAAVDAVLVLLAESPLELERSHPALYRSWKAAWMQVYPDQFQPEV